MHAYQPSSENAFTIERHGDALLIRVAPSLESLDPGHVEGAVELVLKPIQDLKVPLVVFDLSGLSFVGSAFLAVMIRCWKQVSTRGGTMVLTGISKPVRDLLRMTSLDRVWPIYQTRSEALEALASD